MKMYLRHRSEPKYYTGKEGVAMWSKNKLDAKAFLDFPTIDQLCDELSLKHAEIVVDHSDGEVIIQVLPPGQRKRRSPQ